MNRIRCGRAEREEGEVNGKWLLSSAPSHSSVVRLRQDSPVIAREYGIVLSEVYFVKNKRTEVVTRHRTSSCICKYAEGVFFCQIKMSKALICHTIV